jgi:hypothetical protein
MYTNSSPDGEAISSVLEVVRRMDRSAIFSYDRYRAACIDIYGQCPISIGVALQGRPGPLRTPSHTDPDAFTVTPYRASSFSSSGRENQRSFFPASLPEEHSKTSVTFRTRRERHLRSALLALTISFIFS